MATATGFMPHRALLAILREGCGLLRPAREYCGTLALAWPAPQAHAIPKQTIEPMKRHLFTAVLSAATALASAQTATNFTCADCHGEVHDLFAELDAGKVIVIDWVMPCSSCTGPTLTTYNVVQSYQASHPGRVQMFLVDDYGNTSCSSLNTWKANIGVPNTISFSNAAISMNDYGGPGMPKIVVLGGSGHTVFYTANNTVDATALQNAINAALVVAGVEERNPLAAGLSVVPVPATDEARITFTLAHASPVSIGLYDPAGKLVRSIHDGPLPPGPHSATVAVGALAAGLYAVRITDGTHLATLRLPITH